MTAFLYYLKEELLFIKKEAGLKLLLFVGIPFLTVWFAGAYASDYVYHIPIAVLDEDNSELSRSIIEHFDKNERFQVTHHVYTRQELQNTLDSQEAYMGLYIPPDLNENVLSGKTTQVLILTNGANVIIGNNAYASAATIVQTVSAGASIKIISAKGSLPQISATNMALPFQFTDRMLYDPQMTYLNYLIYGFVAVFFQQLLLSGLATLILRNPQETVKKHTLRRLGAKITAATSCLIFTGSLAILWLHKGMHVVLTGNVFLALALSILFAIAISCPAILLTAITKDKTKFSQISYMLSLPTFLTCGYVWPADQMPFLLKGMVKITWPLIYYARTFDEILVKNLPLKSVLPNAMHLIIYSAIFMPISIYVWKKRFGEPKETALSIAETNSIEGIDIYE